MFPKDSILLAARVEMTRNRVTEQHIEFEMANKEPLLHLLRIQIPSGLSFGEELKPTTYAIHKVDSKALSSASPYFESLLSGKMGDGIPCSYGTDGALVFDLLLEDTDQAMWFPAFLDFSVGEAKGQIIEQPSKAIFQIAILADKFMVENVLKCSMTVLSTLLTPRTTHRYFGAPKTFKLGPGQSLMRRVKELAIVAFDATRGFGGADIDTVCAILERPETKGHENEIFDAMVDWADSTHLSSSDAERIHSLIRVENMSTHCAASMQQVPSLVKRCKCLARPVRPEVARVWERLAHDLQSSTG